MKKTLNLRLRTYKKCKHEWGTFSTKGKEKRNAMVNELKNMKLNNPDMEQLRCLLIGPIGAGKSSFINSVKSVFQGYMAHGALAAALSSKGFTNTYKTCYIRNGTNRLPFALSDVMGLEPSEGYGIHPDDIINALKGHLPNGYKFCPLHPLTTECLEYNKHPKSSDKVHCLVNVISADKIALMSSEVITKMKKIREKASELEIPQVVVMTMPDKACDLVEKDVKKIYTSIVIKKKMQTCSNELGVPVNCILPVKNYHEEVGLDNDMDILILNAISQIMNFANDCI
ncbi:interferon-induced protein 44 isoform X1 [Esox lucius]|uniref:interferon-induced protein 44 isoform X1 n=1 Tax=Esox lucius TaxID=8010 RepID=UPI0010BD7109|nr:interferon-induced protein 44 isoform X1 [Esox lucius]